MSRNSMRLLVVDDIQDNRSVLVRRLARHGFEVAEAEGGRTALDLLSRENFDLVLLDIMMPDLDGIEVLRRIRQTRSPSALPVLMVTANNESAETASALRQGANDYITKPIDFPVALARIEAQLARKEAQEKMESQLERADQRLRSLVDHLPAGLALKDTDGRFLIMNAQYGAYLGLDPRNILGRPQSLLIDGASADIARLDRTALAAGTPQQAQVELNDASGSRVLFATSFPILCSGFVIGVGTSLMDVTERWRAERELMLARDAAEAGNRAKSEFLSAMSHELRTPLNAIIGFADLMAEGMHGPLGHPNYVEYVRDIGDSGRHLLGIINDILDLAKLETGRMDLDEEIVEVPRLVARCVQLVSRVAACGDVRVETNVEPDLPPVRGDARRLAQILLNLLSNAVKFTPPGGRVDVVARIEGGRVAITVRDTGIGMAEEDIAKAFEPFRQIDSSLSRRYPGTGLGLPISKKLTEMHGGCLDIQSANGLGTRVTLTLPPDRTLEPERAR